MISSENMERYLDMISPYVYPTVATFVVILCGVASWLVYYRWQNRHLPPGPPGLPLVGYLPFLSGDMHSFSKLSDTFGEIMHLKLGKKNAVILGSFEALKKAFIDQPNVFDGRGDIDLIRDLWSGETGILMSEGEKWSALRNFAVKNLKMADFTEALHKETIEMISVLKTDHEKIHDSRLFILQVVANVLCNWTLGSRLSYTDTLFQSYIKNFQEVADLMHHCSFQTLLPSLNPFSSKSPQMQQLELKFKEKMGFIGKMIQSKTTPNGRSNFAEIFLAEGSNFNDNSKWFTERELTMVVNDLWGAGTEATTSTLQWAIFYMLKEEEIQRKIQAELDAVFGTTSHNLVTPEDKEKLPWTCATLQEVERCASVAPFGVLRCNVEETKLDEFKIPFRCLIFPNLWRINHAPQNWERPFDFYPERFLSEEGVVTRPPFLVPCSIGSRACPFQSAGSNQLFVLFANLLRCFTLKKSPSDVFLPSDDEKISALTLRPKDFSFIATPRFDHLLPDTLESHFT